MTSSYKKLGDYIKEVNVKNTDLSVTNLIGVSIEKKFIKSVANIIGTDMSNYKLITKNQLACKLMSVGRDEKLPVDLYLENEASLISSAYYVFEPKDKNELLPEYLKMWLFRSETDRYVGYVSGGDVRGGISWDTFCEIPIKIPTPEQQQQLVNEYHTLQKRIDLNNQLIATLEQTAQTIYKQWFVEGIDLENLPEGWEIKKLQDFCDIKGGKRLPKGEELNDNKNGNPYIKVADMTKKKFVVLNNSFQYVADDIQKSISRYIVQNGDIIISIVGTIGLVNIIDSSLDEANLTENCYRLTNFKTVHSDYIYYYLISPLGKQEIELRTVGGVQGKLPMYNVQSLPIVLPNEDLLEKFEKSLNPINKSQAVLTKENQKLEELKELLLGKMAKVEGKLETIEN
ncbi:restriction endonuclease subunit S [Flavobacterium sp. CYK-55]|uniref:restriction endonuclease subunit S n=1 Tax=Flavobacterium sp. CYK-55 TaxID=2835529 RepID=UPI001BD170E6|nr:restriction endonuclease subunit S [Flavobacterium sp. CYK-55]MBS7786617.1 restriction endonuclease subunit S [Flavobacterium sp. CYK-55]